jgi:hypothetical protein
VKTSGFCIVGKEHCPYCGGHDTIAISASLRPTFRGAEFWCGYCHSSFDAETPKQPYRNPPQKLARGTEGQS